MPRMASSWMSGEKVIVGSRRRRMLRHAVPGTRNVEFPGMRIQSTRNELVEFPGMKCKIPGTSQTHSRD